MKSLKELQEELAVHAEAKRMLEEENLHSIRVGGICYAMWQRDVLAYDYISWLRGTENYVANLTEEEAPYGFYIGPPGKWCSERFGLLAVLAHVHPSEMWEPEEHLIAAGMNPVAAYDAVQAATAVNREAPFDYTGSMTASTWLWRAFPWLNHPRSSENDSWGTVYTHLALAEHEQP